MRRREDVSTWPSLAAAGTLCVASLTLVVVGVVWLVGGAA